MTFLRYMKYMPALNFKLLFMKSKKKGIIFTIIVTIILVTTLLSQIQITNLIY